MRHPCRCSMVKLESKPTTTDSGRNHPFPLRRGRGRAPELECVDVHIPNLKSIHNFIRLPHFVFYIFSLSCEYCCSCLLRFSMAPSSSKKTETHVSPLAALTPLHALAQLIPAAPAGKGGRDFDFVLLTSLKPDAWFVHVGHPDGRWWNGAWYAADIENLAVSDPPPPLFLRLQVGV